MSGHHNPSPLLGLSGSSSVPIGSWHLHGFWLVENAQLVLLAKRRVTFWLAAGFKWVQWWTVISLTVEVLLILIGQCRWGLNLPKTQVNLVNVWPFWSILVSLEPKIIPKFLKVRGQNLTVRVTQQDGQGPVGGTHVWSGCTSKSHDTTIVPVIVGIQDVKIIKNFAVVIAIAVYLCHSVVWCCTIVTSDRG